MRKIAMCLLVLMLVLVHQKSVQAQTTGAIGGTIVDSNGAVVPNATVSVKGESGQDFTVTTNESGIYRIPAVAVGVYTVTITSSGFKKAIVSNVKVDIGTPTTVDVNLEVGTVEQTVEVTSGGEVLQTQTATVGTNITGRQIRETPIASRDALDLILKLPGVSSVGAPRRSSINGLPKSAIQMTIDGVDVQDNVLRSSDGFFTFVRPRVDAIEEVTISTANPGAEGSGEGAVQVKFVTKRGTNDYKGTAYWQVRNTALNAAYWYNNRDLKPKPGYDKAPRDVVQLNQPGFSFGGPIPFPHFGEGGPFWHSGKDKAFFFVNYEQFRLPGSIARTRTVLNQDAQNGTFRYIVGTETRSANLFQLAGNAGQINSIDPTVNGVLNEIRAATATTGAFTAIPTDPNRQLYSFQNITNSERNFTAVRVDVNFHKNHSAEFVMNRQNFLPSIDTINGGDPPFPGGSAYGQGGIRRSWSYAVRSTLSQNIVNEARYAISGGGTDFSQGCCAEDYASQFGNFLQIGTPAAITNLRSVTSPNGRTTPSYDLTDNVTWLKGNHSISFGGQYKRIRTEGYGYTCCGTVGFGFDSSESLIYNGIFNTTNLPGANDTQLAEARNLYAALSGRVLSYTRTAVLTDDGTYQAGGNQIQILEQKMYGLYGQDSWKMRENLTFNYGLRWQPRLGVTAESANFSRLESFSQLYGVSGLGNLFKPGTFTGGSVPRTVAMEIGEKAYPDDLNNFAPSVGIVWSPNFEEKGLLGFVFGGKGKSVFRGGFSSSFVREGLNVTLSIIGANPGGSLNASRTVALGNLTPGSLLRSPGNINITPAPFPNKPAYPFTLAVADAANAFSPDLKTGVVHSFSFGYQRELDKNTVVEVRYVGNRGRGLERQVNLNERNMVENGVAAEFALAQQNLYANIQANRCQSGVQNTNPLGAGYNATCQYNFAYFGLGSGTNQLPIALSYFSGAANGNVATLTPGANGTNGTVTSTAAGVAGNYSSALFRDMATFSGLNRVAASVSGYATGLENNAGRRTNALNAGLPSNFMFVSPSVVTGGTWIIYNNQNTWYDSAVIEVRRRLSAGVRVQASYVFSKAQADTFAVSSVVGSNYSQRPDGLDLAKSVQPFDIRHNFKLDTTYDLPFGKGRMFFSNANRLVEALVGGFSILPTINWQSGAPIQIGNVQLIGMTVKDLEKAVKVRKEASLVYWLPDDIILNSRKAFDTSITAANGYGTSAGTGGPTGRFIAPQGYGNCQAPYAGKCGFNNLVIHGPGFFNLDVGVTKRFALNERINFELRANFLNALNYANFKVGGFGVDATGSGCCSATFGQLASGSAYRDTNTTNDPGGRVIDLQFRINF